MNKIWIFCITASVGVLLIISPSLTLSTMIDACENSFRLCFDLLVIYSIWLGILQIAEDSGLSKKLAKGLYPFTKKLFGKLDPETNKLISMNIATNMLGMGGISTPLGIEAMTRMQDGTNKATQNMKLLTVLACTSLQIIPSTVIGLRIAQNSTNPSIIFLPTLIATAFTTILGIILSKLFGKVKKK